MLGFVLHKISYHLGKALCLLLGSILVVGMAACIPVFTTGILQRMLTLDLEGSQITNGRYPGYFSITGDYTSFGRPEAEQYIDRLREEAARLVEAMPVPPLISEEYTQIDNLYHLVEMNGTRSRSILRLGAMTSFNDHIRIVKGRMYQLQPPDGVLEVIATVAALEKTGTLLDHEYDVYEYREKTGAPPLLKIRIVGIYEAADLQSLFWFRDINRFQSVLVTDPERLAGLSTKSDLLAITNQELFSAFDYHDFRIQDASALIQVSKAGSTFAETDKRNLRFSNTFSAVINGYKEREAELRLTLLILFVPILAMLVFYIFMVSQVILQSENPVISLLESRGAGRLRILSIYGIESLLFALASLVIGPLAGLGMVRIIGASTGFLEFANRKSLPIGLDGQAMLYCLAAVVVTLLATLAPVFLQPRTSIVQQKISRSRASRAPFWQRVFLDVLLLGISLYALYRLQAQIVLQKGIGFGGVAMNLDFLLFLASTLFIFGAGLLALRLYPFLIRGLYRIGIRFWGPVLYSTFHGIVRSGSRTQFLMIFLILSLSIGLFNANAARTINRNTEDVIRSQVGSDIRLQEYWTPYDAEGNPIDSPAGSSATVRYVEPDVSRFTRIAGVASAARVYRSDKVLLAKGGKSVDVGLISVDPYDFARTTWTRSDLNHYAMNEYMNVMMSMPNALILSTDLRETLGLEVGDSVFYTVDGSSDIEGVVVAFVAYWPGFQPVTLDVDGHAESRSLLVSNLEFMLSKSSIRPYEVWLRKTADASDKSIYDALEASRISIVTLSSANQEIVKARNDPKREGTNGALTLGFILSILVCGAGFLIYWNLSVQDRVLQFGVFRAMGLGKWAIIGMLASEQVLVSGIAILLGMFLGNLTSFLYVPMFQLVYSSAEQPIPFRVFSAPGDAVKIYLALGVVMLISLVILGRFIQRLRIDSAVKLGEE